MVDSLRFAARVDASGYALCDQAQPTTGSFSLVHCNSEYLRYSLCDIINVRWIESGHADTP